MKGVSVIRAKPSNVLDVYDLYKKAIKEGVQGYPKPLPNQIQEYHWQILEELKRPEHVVFLAKKGRAFYGVIHAIITPRTMGKSKWAAVVRMIYVSDKRRKLGVGKKLADELQKFCADLGISTYEFMCDDSLVEYWTKKRGARKVANYMVVEV